MTLYLKTLGENGEPYHGGYGSWDLPTKRDDGTWKPGKWRAVSGPLKLCSSQALHLCTGLQVLDWWGPHCYVAEAEGEVVSDGNKCGVLKARLLYPVEAWSDRTLRHFAADCAEHVLPIWLRSYPDDTRPAAAIQATRDFADGRIEAAARDAARDAARAAARYAAGYTAGYTAGYAARAAAGYAARAAAGYAAGDTAGAAAWSAAGDAARVAAGAAAGDAAGAAAGDAARVAAGDAARVAAGDAERSWQADQLMVRLGLPDFIAS